jgi:extradiol dioxygenase family protein
MTTVKICIDVTDLDEASAFYCQALQCIEVGRNSRTVKLTAGGNELYLILRPEGSMPFLAATEGRSFARRHHGDRRATRRRMRRTLCTS